MDTTEEEAVEDQRYSLEQLKKCVSNPYACRKTESSLQQADSTDVQWIVERRLRASLVVKVPLH
jgi:hypothetical protein